MTHLPLSALQGQALRGDIPLPGVLVSGFCNSGQNARGPSVPMITGFPDLIDWLELRKRSPGPAAGCAGRSGHRRAPQPGWGRQ